MTLFDVVQESINGFELSVTLMHKVAHQPIMSVVDCLQMLDIAPVLLRCKQTPNQTTDILASVQHTNGPICLLQQPLLVRLIARLILQDLLQYQL